MTADLTSEARQVERIAYQIPDACIASGLGRSTLYNAIRARELAVLKIGKRVLIEAGELRRWLLTKRAA